MSPGMQHSVIQISQPYGLGLNETLLPQYLQKLGYATHAVGKVSGVLVFVVQILHDDLNLERLTMSKGPEESWFCNSLNECHLILWKVHLEYLAFTLENWKFQLKKQKFCAIPFGKVQETWAVIWGDAVFLLFLVCSADLDLCFFYSGFFSYPVKFYCNLRTQKFSTLVVCLHPWCWSLFLFSQLHIRRTPQWHFSNFQRRLERWFWVVKNTVMWISIYHFKFELGEANYISKCMYGTWLFVPYPGYQRCFSCMQVSGTQGIILFPCVDHSVPVFTFFPSLREWMAVFWFSPLPQ